METLKFKTNVNCGGCIATITPHLNQIKGIGKWNVDTSNPLKILTVETDGMSKAKDPVLCTDQIAQKLIIDYQYFMI
jgi:copper chaperone